MVCGFSCSAACGIFPDPGSKLRPLQWQADSYHCTTREVPASFWNVVTVSSWNSDAFQALISECALQAFILHHCPLPPAPASAARPPSQSTAHLDGPRLTHLLAHLCQFWPLGFSPIPREASDILKTGRLISLGCGGASDRKETDLKKFSTDNGFWIRDLQ